MVVEAEVGAQFPLGLTGAGVDLPQLCRLVDVLSFRRGVTFALGRGWPAGAIIALKIPRAT